jgi:hypothetical protein
MPPQRFGAAPVTQLRKSGMKVTWDRPVKAVPERDALDLVRGGGCRLALTVDDAAKRYELTKTAVSALARDGVVTVSVYHPLRGVEEPVIVMDRKSRDALAKAQAEKEAPKRDEGEQP